MVVGAAGWQLGKGAAHVRDHGPGAAVFLVTPPSLLVSRAAHLP